MKIVILINGLGLGGGERLAAESGRELRRRGHQVTYFCLTRGGSVADELRREGFSVEQLTWEGFPRAAGLWHLVAAIRTADIVHTHFYYSDLAARLVGRFVGVRRLISTRHETGFWLGPLQAALEPWLYRGFDRVVCVSDAVRDSLVGRGVPAADLVVVQPGVALVPPVGETAKVVEPFVLYAGRLERIKGPDLLIEAFASLDEPPAAAWRLVLAGDGAARGELVAEIERRGLADRVSLLGAITHDQVLALMRRASVVVLPSRDDAAPLVLLEAMACGTVCIGTAVGGVGEIITDNENGLLVAPNSPAALAAALRRLADSPALAARLGAAGRDKVMAEHSLTRFVDCLLDVYAGN